jgi:hypothetical protein
VSGIFISYRREDATAHAGWLYEGLASHFGERYVFMDLSAMEPGLDFVDQIEQALADCDAMLVIIGPQWATVADTDGNPRLDDPDDFVRLEVSRALEAGLRVIPILVGDAVMPSSAHLPESLRGLARRHAVELRATRWRADVRDLIEVLQEVTGGVVDHASKVGAAATGQTRFPAPDTSDLPGPPPPDGTDFRGMPPPRRSDLVDLPPPPGFS